ncbi:sensor histidine kinase [Desulfofalx alkaliphila]|uniref:sensor histidine kinase n=1 Tax=Desulfofalx alkaliphila TaxID=105483 RepID=UPI0004E181BD|nr:HAMP domain-containing sensor histidine kinase [Desulfofalx alkaliphila]
MINHELKNSVTILRGIIHYLMRDKGDCNHCKKHFNIMLGELDRASLLLKEYMKQDKTRPVKYKLNNLNDVIKSVYPMIRAKAALEKKDLKIILGEIPDVYIDAEEARILIINLVLNGLESMDEGRLTIKTYQETDKVVLVVEDQGNGINQHVIDKIGTPFITTKECGTGLGLATCLDIISKYKASHEIKTGSRGTQFFVRFKKQIN